jgi:hypothetical protein
MWDAQLLDRPRSFDAVVGRDRLGRRRDGSRLRLDIASDWD